MGVSVSVAGLGMRSRSVAVAGLVVGDSDGYGLGVRVGVAAFPVRLQRSVQAAAGLGHPTQHSDLWRRGDTLPGRSIGGGRLQAIVVVRRLMVRCGAPVLPCRCWGVGGEWRVLWKGSGCEEALGVVGSKWLSGEIIVHGLES